MLGKFKIRHRSINDEAQFFCCRALRIEQNQQMSQEALENSSHLLHITLGPQSRCTSGNVFSQYTILKGSSIH